MKLDEHRPLNGKVEAPPISSGASTLSSTQTVFPQVAVARSLQSLLYYGSRYRLGGLSPFRWLLMLMVLVALLSGVGLIPGRWWTVAPAVLSWALALALYFFWRKRDYVRFTAEALPTVAPRRLDPADKVPLFATGYLTVENKEQRFTWLPGFYRTFATREHALICYIATKPRGGIGQWPQEEVGLWYLFFQPDEMAVLAWGELSFGRTRYPAVAITYEREIPRRGRWRPAKTLRETIYLAVSSPDDGRKIVADLFYDSRLQPKSADRQQWVRVDEQ